MVYLILLSILVLMASSSFQYPIVFGEIRQWSPGISGLAFVGIGTGTVIALCCDPLCRKIYNMHSVDPDTGKRPPEARILVVCVAAVLIPVSMLWFAWTCSPSSIHWIWPILSVSPPSRLHAPRRITSRRVCRMG